ALKKAGVALDTPITASFKNFTLNVALHHLLKDLGLHHVVANGEILITAGTEPAGEDLEAVGKARVERKTIEERQKEAQANVAAAEKARLAQMQARAAQVQAAAIVDPAQAAADFDAMEKQFTRRF